ncbi:hypothetical protein ACGWY0_002738 [Enterococcus hirae]
MFVVDIYFKNGDVTSMKVDNEIPLNEFKDNLVNNIINNNDTSEKWFKFGDIHDCNEIYIPVSSINYIKIRNDLT